MRSTEALRVSDLPLLALKLSLLVFMAGSLMEMGLGLRLRDALSGLRDRASSSMAPASVS